MPRLFAGLASLQTSCYSTSEGCFTFVQPIRPPQQFKPHHLPPPGETGGAGTHGHLVTEPDSPAACARALPRAPPALPSRQAEQPRVPVPVGLPPCEQIYWGTSDSIANFSAPVKFVSGWIMSGGGCLAPWWVSGGLPPCESWHGGYCWIMGAAPGPLSLPCGISGLPGAWGCRGV